jgi:hypothetical protein
MEEIWMSFNNQPQPSGVAGGETSDISIGTLVGEVYDLSSAEDRRRLLDHLLQPLGLLSLLAVANGVFAKIWFRRGWQDLRIRAEDTALVSPSDVAALVDYVQQACIETIDGLVNVLTSSPALSATTAAALLTAALVARIRSQRSRSAIPERSSEF